MNTNKKLAARLREVAPSYPRALQVAAILCDRRGTKRGFEKVDEGTRLEIIETLAAIIREAHRADQTGKGEKNGL